MAKRLTTEEFIEKARIVHGNKYGYSEAEYKNNHTKLMIICKKHGVFLQTSNDHLDGHGCNTCGREVIIAARKLSEIDFIAKAQAIHGDKYDYSEAGYSYSNKRVTLKCKKHGVFTQTAGHHLNGHGCQKCANETIKDLRIYSREEFLVLAKNVYGDEYDYSKVDYTGSKDKIRIICKKHGEFEQMPYSHLQGHSCPGCANIGPSKPETNFTDWVETMVGVKRSDRGLISPLEIDCLVPDKKIGIEFCGTYYHSDDFTSDNKHLLKLELAAEKGYGLLHIFDDEWEGKQPVVKSILRNRLGLTEARIFARNTVLKEVSVKDCKDFLNANHIQGHIPSEIRLGLYSGDALVMLATFSDKRSILHKLDKGWYEMVRLCPVINTVVIGGLSKLLSGFKTLFDPKGIKTFCDRRYFNGEGYEASGFVKMHDSAPNYYYLKRDIRYSRFMFQKHKLKAKLPIFDESLSEKENMRNNGYARIYDCGNSVFKLDYSQ